MLVVSVFSPRHGAGHLEVLERAATALLDRGIQILWNVNLSPKHATEGDLLVVHNCLLDGYDHVQSLGRRVIVFERSDCSMPFQRWLPTCEEVLSIVKGSLATFEMVNNAGRRPHEDVLLGEFKSQDYYIHKEEYEKFDIFGGFGQYNRMQSWLHEEIHGPRDIDVSFVGTTAGKPEAIESHRLACIAAVKHLDGRTTVSAPGRPCSAEGYKDLLRRSKVVVSPWGNGETCYRDYEAILAGCELVKPECNWVKTEPDVFAHATWCDKNFENLSEIVTSVLSKWDQRTEWRENARENIARAWQPEYLAEQFYALVERALQRQRWKRCGLLPLAMDGLSRRF